MKTIYDSLGTCASLDDLRKRMDEMKNALDLLEMEWMTYTEG